MHYSNKRLSSGINIYCVFVALCINISSAQVHSVQTYIAYYAGLSEKQKSSLIGYSILVNDPQATTKLQNIFDAQNGLTVFHYLDLTELEPGRPWTKDILEHHKDFFLKTIGSEFDKNLPFRAEYAWGFEKPYDTTGQYKDSYYLDPRSKGWMEYYTLLADSCLVLQNSQGREGIFADNVIRSIRAHFADVPKNLQVDLNGDGVMDWRDDTVWVNAMIEFSKVIKSRLGPNVPLIGNMGWWWPYGTAGFQIVATSAFDGVMNESFVHSSLSTDSTSYLSIENWKININDIMVADCVGKILLCQSFGQEQDSQARLFCLGSFLLGAREKSYFNYKYHHSYDVLYHFPEFSLSLGNPKQTFANIDQAFERSLGLFKRAFDSVTVFVNPFRYKVKLDLGNPRKALRLIGGVREQGGSLVGKRNKCLIWSRILPL